MSPRRKSKTLTPASVRVAHRRLLARRLWTHGRTSRADLARQTGLSRSTISAVVDDLLQMKWVLELGEGSSRGGRRPVVLGFNHDAKLAVGVDMGASHVTVALCNLSGTISAWRHEAHPVRDDPAGSIELICRLVDDVLREEPDSKERTLGVGLSVPSPVVSAEPNRLPAVIMPKWVGYDLEKAVRASANMPVMMDNDANVGALAELRWGAGRGRQHLIYIKVATGIGAGIIINGAVYKGFNGIAGEIAHTSIDANGPLCECGQRGCLVLFVGTDALLEQAREEGGDSLPDSINATWLVDAALAGDKVARKTIADAGHWIGIGIANLLNVVDPGMVILGGELTRAELLLTEPIIQSVRERALSFAVGPTQILTSTLKDHGIALGAATQVINQAFERDDLFVM